MGPSIRFTNNSILLRGIYERPNIPPGYRGVVQGNNVAALLGMIILETMDVYNLKHGKLIGYADDGVLFGDSEDIVNEWKSKRYPIITLNYME